MNRVHVQMFHMVPIDAQGRPDPQHDPARSYGFEAHDDDYECSDYDMSLKKLQHLCHPARILDTLYQYHEDLADIAQSDGLYLNDVWIPAENLTLSENSGEDFEEEAD